MDLTKNQRLVLRCLYKYSNPDSHDRCRMAIKLIARETKLPYSAVRAAIAQLIALNILQKRKNNVWHSTIYQRVSNATIG
jgi:DNA-binding MarR family transcriptional regulator